MTHMTYEKVRVQYRYVYTVCSIALATAMFNRIILSVIVSMMTVSGIRTRHMMEIVILYTIPV